MDDDQLQRNEYAINCYTIRFARFGSRGWTNSSPWMRLLVTSRRLIFSAQETPATPEQQIERSKVNRCWNAAMGRRSGIILELYTGELVHMFVDWSQGDRLVKDILEMLTQPAPPRISPRLPQETIVN